MARARSVVVEDWQQRGSIEGRSVSMYPQEWAVVHQIAKDTGLGSRSAGLRFIIQDWQRLRAEERARLRRMQILQAHRDGHVTDAEKDAALRSLGFGGDGNGESET